MYAVVLEVFLLWRHTTRNIENVTEYFCYGRILLRFTFLARDIYLKPHNRITFWGLGFGCEVLKDLWRPFLFGDHFVWRTFCLATILFGDHFSLATILSGDHFLWHLFLFGDHFVRRPFLFWRSCCLATILFLDRVLEIPKP